jgi:hypothetical protein
MTALERLAVIAAVIATYALLAALAIAMRRGLSWDSVIARLDHQRGRLRRRRAGTHLLEEMAGHPERIREMPDPVANEVYADIAEQLLDDGMADIAEDTGWTQ